MAKTIFILGAGASKDCGAPLMKEFLDYARDLAAGTRLDENDKKDFVKVFDALVELRGVFFKSGLDLDNIESIFSAFDMAQLVGKLGNLKSSKINELDRAIKKVIIRTLEDAIKFKANIKYAEPPISYHKFVELLKGMEKDRNQTWSVMTFNYDHALDYAFCCNKVSVDYCLDEKLTPGKKPYLKLHGSLGWGHCKQCETMGIVEIGRFSVRDPKYAGRFAPYPITKKLTNLRHEYEYCEGTFEPMIVPPTWNKGQHHEQIGNVWRQAAIELGEAENIIVMGYSLPETDLFFRYLYALGTVGKAHIRRFWVFNPDKNPQVEKRFRDLIGKGIEDRFEYFPKTFSEGLSHLIDNPYWKQRRK